MLKMQLTKLESDILRHRLDVPDSIAECLNDTADAFYDDETMRASWHPDDISDCCEMIARGDYDAAYEFNRDMFCEIMIECIDGSTYYAAALSSNESPQKLSAITRAGNSLARKIQKMLGLETPPQFPWY